MGFIKGSKRLMGDGCYCECDVRFVDGNVELNMDLVRYFYDVF